MNNSCTCPFVPPCIFVWDMTNNTIEFDATESPASSYTKIKQPVKLILEETIWPNQHQSK